MKNQLKFILRINDNDHSALLKARDEGPIKSVKVKIEATHSGIINQNYFFYTPFGMKSGAKTFIEPYAKPVMVAHDSNADPIGRILKSKYVDYPEILSGVKDIKDPMDGIDVILDFIKKDKNFKAKDYKGLGHIELIAEITDQDAIQKVLDNRYLTVSIGGAVDKAICSICGQDKKQEDSSVPYEERCNHWRGETYDGEKAFYIGGKMVFDEVSYVNTPADKHAKGEVINDKVDDAIFSEQRFEILDFEVGEKIGVSKLKKKLKDILADKNIVSDTLKTLGLESFALEDERYGKLRKTSFLFANDRALPVNDKAHIVAAYQILSEVEDSKDLEEAMEVLGRKFENLFGGQTLEDAKKELIDSVKTEDGASEDKLDKETSTFDYEKFAKELSDKVVLGVVEKLKDSVKVSDSFLGQRNEALEAEVATLEEEINMLTDRYRSAVVFQILAKENKVDDSAYREKLETRTLDSLHDKLEDLGLVAGQDKTSTKEESNVADKSTIKDTSVDIEDASDESGELQDSSSDKQTDENNNSEVTLTVKQVNDQYKSILRKQGFVAARRYLKDLDTNKQLPDNFTFA